MTLRLLLFIFLFCTACSRPNGKDRSSLHIRFPSAAEFNKAYSKTRGLASKYSVVPYENLCFAVNIKNGKIPTAQASQCEIEKGLMVGSVEPGKEISLNVALHQEVDVEIYGFLRNSTTELCPITGLEKWQWPVEKTFFIDTQKKVPIESDVTNLTFAITLPDINNHLAVQNSWPSSCLVPVVAGQNLDGRVNNGSSILQGNHFKFYVRSSGVADLPILSGTHFQIKSWRPR